MIQSYQLSGPVLVGTPTTLRPLLCEKVHEVGVHGSTVPAGTDRAKRSARVSRTRVPVRRRSDDERGRRRGGRGDRGKPAFHLRQYHRLHLLLDDETPLAAERVDLVHPGTFFVISVGGGADLDDVRVHGGPLAVGHHDLDLRAALGAVGAGPGRSEHPARKTAAAEDVQALVRGNGIVGEFHADGACVQLDHLLDEVFQYGQPGRCVFGRGRAFRR